MDTTAKQDRHSPRFDPLVATAYHEAGHAVASNRLGFEFRLVTIVPTQEARGSLARNRLKAKLRKLAEGDVTANDMARWHDYILTVLAGGEAQRKFRPSSLRRYMLSGDYDNIQTTLEALHPQNEQPPVLRWLRIRTRNFINRPLHWRYVEDVASALLEHRTLTGADVTAIIRKSFQTQMLEARRHRMNPPVAGH